MADLRISELPQLIAADLDGADDLPITDYSASETRRLGAKNLVQEGVKRLIDDGVIPGGKIEGNSIEAAQLAAGSVTEAALGTAAVTEDKIGPGALTSSKYGAGSIPASAMGANSVGTTALIDGSITADKIAVGALDGGDLQTGSVGQAALAKPSVDTAEIFDGAVDSNKLAGSAVQAANIKTGAVGTDALADDSVSTPKLQAGSVTGPAIADAALQSNHYGVGSIPEAAMGAVSVGTTALIDESVTDEKIALGALNGTKLQSGSVGQNALAKPSVDAAELFDGAVEAGKLASEAVEAANIKAGAVGTAALADDSISTPKLQAGSVTGSAIADGTLQSNHFANGAVDSNALATGSVTDGVIAPGTITSDEIQVGGIQADRISSVDGAVISADSIPPEALDDVTDRGLDQVSGSIGHTNAIAAGTKCGIQYDEHGHIVSTSGTVPPTDLPAATQVDRGAVSIPSNSGLSVSPAGALTHANTVTAKTVSGISYDAQGHITGAVPLIDSDLPVATTTTVGGVIVPGSDGLGVDAAGTLRHSSTGVAPGEYVSVTVDSQGHVQAGETSLDPAQVPSLPADKITSGELNKDLIADASITSRRLADYATVLMQEDNPGKGDYLGQLWFTPSTAQLRIYARGSGSENLWTSVGFGNLQQNNLRWLGTYDADTDSIISVTAQGTSQGVKAGDPFPVSSDSLSGGYFVCAVAGSNCTQPALDGINHTAGDWAICLDQAQGWTHIDVNGGGGGGGGASYLRDLLDVNIGSPGPFSTEPRSTLSDRQMLKYESSSGMWRNTDFIDGGTY